MLSNNKHKRGRGMLALEIFLYFVIVASLGVVFFM